MNSSFIIFKLLTNGNSYAAKLVSDKVVGCISLRSSKDSELSLQVIAKSNLIDMLK